VALSWRDGPWVADTSAWARAQDVPDALIAAAAAERGFAVLHYDQHFDRLATVLSFTSQWIAEPGSID
jgi:predicted nucleic acid-binding protein